MSVRLHWAFFTRRGAAPQVACSCLTVASRIRLVGVRSARGNRAAARPSGQLRTQPDQTAYCEGSSARHGATDAPGRFLYVTGRPLHLGAISALGPRRDRRDRPASGVEDRHRDGGQIVEDSLTETANRAGRTSKSWRSQVILGADGVADSRREAGVAPDLGRVGVVGGDRLARAGAVGGVAPTGVPQDRRSTLASRRRSRNTASGPSTTERLTVCPVILAIRVRIGRATWLQDAAGPGKAPSSVQVQPQER